MREAVEIRFATDPELWTAFNTQSIPGGVLLSQERYDEAEPLLLAGYQGMPERAETIGRASWHRVLLAIERLVELYDATDRLDESARWRAELERARDAKDG